MKSSALQQLINVLFCYLNVCADIETLQHHYRRLQKRSSANDDVTLVMGSSTTIAATVGSNRILQCEIRYPSDTKVYIEHIITWRKQGTEVYLVILVRVLAKNGNKLC